MTVQILLANIVQYERTLILW